MKKASKQPYRVMTKEHVTLLKNMGVDEETQYIDVHDLHQVQQKVYRAACVEAQQAFANDKTVKMFKEEIQKHQLAIKKLQGALIGHQKNSPPTDKINTISKVLVAFEKRVLQIGHTINQSKGKEPAAIPFEVA